jgi:SecD/SecF fusion protein
MNGPEAFLIAQAEAPKPTGAAKTYDTAAKPETTGGGKADAGPMAKTPAAAENEPADKSEPKPAEKSNENPQPKPSGSAVPAKREPKPADEPSAPPSTASVTGATTASEAPEARSIEASLSFDVGQGGGEGAQKPRFEKEQLRSMIQHALEADGFPPKSILVEATNEGKSDVSDHWKATFTPIVGAKVTLTPAAVDRVLKSVTDDVSKQPYFPGVDKMGSAVAGDTRFWACVALVLSWTLIIIYLWIRFQGVAFGLAAVIALIHDVLVMLGAIAFSSYLALIPGVTLCTLIEPFKINLTIVAAFLTIIGYSVNDTIVVFDRIREIRGKSPTLTRQMVNDATNQTLSRTLLTSFTVLLVVLILYVFGGQAVHGFAFALFIGVLTGTYSSIYVAAPILLWVLHPKEMQAGTRSGEALPTR